MDASPIIPISVASLELTNFRLFSELKVELHPELTIFIAPNAGGKTSIIDGLAKNLAGFLDIYKELTPSDIREKSQTNNGDFWIKSVFLLTKDMFFPVAIKDIQNNILFHKAFSDNFKTQSKKLITLVFSKPYSFLTNSSSLETHVTYGNQYSLFSEPETREIKKQISKSLDHDLTNILPLLSYFTANRRISSNESTSFMTMEEKTLSRETAYRNLLFCEHLGSFDLWLRERAISALETRLIYQEQGITKEPPEDSHLKAVSKVLATMLSSEVGIETVKYFASEKGIRAVTKSGERIDINQLSHGAKSILTIAAQLAMNSCALNPHLRDQAPEYTPGIVLIDEIDLHLHPKWQHHVLEDLRRCFPRMQFIVTTHSPAILSTVKREHIRVIEVDYSTGIGTATTPQSRSYGESIADTLETIMNVPSRPQNELVKRINAYLDWAENGDLTEDKSSERSALEQELGTEHHDLFNADLIIRRRKILAARG